LRRLAIMLAAFTFLAAPVQGLLAVYVQEIMHGDSRLYGTMLGAIGLGALCGALIIGKIPAYYPRHHLIPLAMAIGSCFILAFTLSAVPWVCFAALVGVGFFWMLSINSSNAAAQLLAGDENRGRIMSVILLCIQGFMPLGHLFASALAHFVGPAWIIRGMVSVLLVIALGFLIKREPAIDAMEKRGTKLTWYQGLWEALTAQSHRPVPAVVRTELADESATMPDTPRNG
jgi:MFS family permease